jgi:hypothetical protein
MCQPVHGAVWAIMGASYLVWIPGMLTGKVCPEAYRTLSVQPEGLFGPARRLPGSRQALCQDRDGLCQC